MPTQHITQLSASRDTSRRLRLLLVVSLVALVGLFPLFQTQGYFLTAFVCFLLASELFAPTERETKWWRRVIVVRAVGWLVAAWFISRRILVALS